MWVRGPVLHKRYHREHLVVVLLDKHGAALFEEAGGEAVRDGHYQPFMRAQQRGDLVYMPGGLLVKASAVVVASLADGAVGAGGFLLAVPLIEPQPGLLIYAGIDVPDGVSEIGPVADELHAGEKPAVGSDRYLASGPVRSAPPGSFRGRHAS